MLTNRLQSAVLTLALVLACAALPVWADRDSDDDRGRREQPRRGPEQREGQQRTNEQRETQHRATEQRETQRRDNVRRDAAIKRPPGYVLDNRYRHDRYYPPRGQAVPILPKDHRVVPYRGENYYFHSGVWYRHSESRFVVILPPIGLVAPFLPPFYTTVWVGGLPYYYAGGVYYTWYPEERGYVVAQAPPESEVSEQTAAENQLFIYPKMGQNEQQQATDRYQCHRWAADQTGFDPTQPGGNVAESQIDSKRDDYRRAMKACLEARGYSVQ